jgi:hypothetical protein
MARVFLVLILIVACVAGLGFYRGWFSLGSDDGDGKTHIKLTVDKDKIQSDKEKVLDKVHNIGHPATDKSTAPAEKTGAQP